MNEYPILFNTEMVRAILAGKKTQTRRVMKIQPIDILPMSNERGWVTLDKRGGNIEDNRGSIIRCRYGKPGDKLWVRETWCPNYYSDGRVGYKADWRNPLPEVVAETKWKPSIFMPKSAARIWLEIVDVRVERVRSITSTDAIAEGINIDTENFHELWNSINAKRGFGWDVNPWVWVVEFSKT